MYMIQNESLVHHGIPEQKWGVRRFQYKDGSLTPEGEKRYYKKKYKDTKRAYKAGIKSASDVASAKIDYKIAKDKNKELNTYARFLSRSSPRSLKREVIYTELAANKGKEYADRALSKGRKKKLTRAAIETLAVTGAGIAAVKLGPKLLQL